MGDKSGINWTGATWNPVTGCDRCSEGCTNCYALTLAARLKAMGSANYQNDGDPKTSGPGFGVTVHPHMLDVPLRWAKPRKIFVNSMSDLFHSEVPVEFIAQVFAVMSLCPQHTFQVLTKRSKRMVAVLTGPTFEAQVREWRQRIWADRPHTRRRPIPAWDGWPLRNVWAGVTLDTAKNRWRVDDLRKTPAAVRWISAEPLLTDVPNLDLDQIDWLVVGGESGPHARPIHPAWVRRLRERARTSRWCRSGCDSLEPGCDHYDCTCGGPHHTAFWFKQWGEHMPLPLDDWRKGDHIMLPSGALCGPATLDDGERAAAVTLRRVGASKAGHLIDGDVVQQFPEVRL